MLPLHHARAEAWFPSITRRHDLSDRHLHRRVRLPRLRVSFFSESSSFLQDNDAGELAFLAVFGAFQLTLFMIRGLFVSVLDILLRSMEGSLGFNIGNGVGDLYFFAVACGVQLTLSISL